MRANSAVVVGILALSSAVACVATEDDSGAHTADGMAPAAGAEPFGANGQASEPGVLVYEHAYSETGRFAVYEHTGGILQAVVTGSESDSNELGATAIWKETFAEVVRTLSPEVEAPDVLKPLDARLSDYRRTVASLTPNGAPPLPLVSSPVVEKSYQWFLDNVCRKFVVSSSWEHLPWGCWYSGPVHYLTTSVGYNNHPFAHQNSDRVYALNDSSHTTWVYICEDGGSWCSGNIQLNPGYWGWMYWTVPPFTNDYYGVILTSGGSGALGITIHYAVPIIK